MPGACQLQVHKRPVSYMCAGARREKTGNGTEFRERMMRMRMRRFLLLLTPHARALVLCPEERTAFFHVPKAAGFSLSGRQPSAESDRPAGQPRARVAGCAGARHDRRPKAKAKPQARSEAKQSGRAGAQRADAGPVYTRLYSSLLALDSLVFAGLDRRSRSQKALGQYYPAYSHTRACCTLDRQ